MAFFGQLSKAFCLKTYQAIRTLSSVILLFFEEGRVRFAAKEGEKNLTEPCVVNQSDVNAK